ncbi:MAG: class B sortase [Clostridiales bacterium]|nr:class B sortase [Candidatus Crickella caballi]
MSKGRKKTNSRVRKIAADVIIICLLGIIAVCGYNLYTIFRDYKADQNSYTRIQESAVAEEFDGNVDFDALKAINPDVIAWLYLKDTKINYPVVKAPDNSKYLSTLFDGSAGGAGTLFTDCYTENPFGQFSTIVYGHHMKDKSMFCSLDYFRDSSFTDEHPQFELVTPEGEYHLEVWAYVNVPSDSKLYTVNVSGNDREPYLNMIRENADYLTDVSVGVDDNIVLLSTCGYEYENARHVVVCKMVPRD